MLREKFTAHQEAKQARKDEAQADYEAAQLTLDVDRPLDALVTDDKEILGQKSEQLFRDRYRNKTDSIVRKIGKAETNIDNKGLREQYLDFRTNRVNIKIARVEEKLANTPDSFLMKYINNGRRFRLRELQHSRRVISNSASHLETKRQNKPESLQKKIDDLVKKKVDAMYKKAQRKEMRENGIEAHNFVARAEFLAKMSPDTKKKIAREAILLARKKSIEKGTLDASHTVDQTLNMRKVVNEYGRVIE